MSPTRTIEELKQTPLRPLILVALFSAGLSVIGGAAKDLMAGQRSQAATIVRVDNTEKQVAALQANAATKQDLAMGLAAVNDRLDDMRDLLLQVRDRKR